MQLSFEPNTNPILNSDGIIEYYDHFFDQKVDYYFKLKNEIHWNQDFIKMYGKVMPLPRLTAFYGDSGINYQYSKINNSAMPWTDFLLEIKNSIEIQTKENFNCVLINYYRNGSDHMSYHADDEVSLGVNPTIASASFGAARSMQFKNRDKLFSDLKIELNSHSLLIMRGKLQHHWLHKILPSKKISEGRINLTFRKIISKSN